MKKETQSDPIMKTLPTSLLVCVPSFALSLYLMQTRMEWVRPDLITTMILMLMTGNIALLAIMEQHRSRIGILTCPALLSAVGLSLLFMVAESVERFHANIDYQWFFPAVLIASMLSCIAIFKERQLFMKFQLGATSIALTIMWCMGAGDKLSLPF